MKIGIFSDTYPPAINGVATSIITLQKALEQQGHEVLIVTANLADISYQIEDNIIKLPGIPLGIYDYRMTGLYPLKIINKIKEWDLDVIHSHSFFTVGLFARIIAKKLEIPLIHTYHTMIEDYTHYVDKRGVFKKTTEKIIKPITDYYCDKTIEELIVPTKKTYNLFKEKYQYDRDVHIIPTGINLEKFYSENYQNKDIQKLKNKYQFNNEDFVLLYVGRIAKEKDVEFLIKNHLKKNNHKLLIVGDGPDRNILQEKTQKNQNIIFTGKVNYEKIGLYYQLADIFVTASQTETQGLTIIEALAAGIPVVAINDPAFREVINKNNGYLFNTREEYQKIIGNLSNDEDLLNKLKKQGRQDAEQYSDENYANRVMDIYQLAIKSKKKVK